MGENLDLTKEFLKNAPAGEYEQCSAALKAILSDDDILAQAREETHKDWYEKNAISVKVDDHRVIICKEGNVGGNEYIDPVTLNKFNYNFETKEVTNSGSASSGDFRNELQEQVNGLIEAGYGEHAAGGAYEDGDDVMIVMSSASISLKNFRTGSVVSRYKVSPSGHIEGRIEASQHYFERGNSLCTHGANIDANAASGSAKDIAKKIRDFESKWLADYKESLALFSSEVIGRFRFKLPYSKSTLNWEAAFTTGIGMKR